MSKPPFVMSKYVSRDDLLSDAASYYEAECVKLRNERDSLQDGIISRDMTIEALRQRVKELEDANIKFVTEGK